jgi:hypothetical protein
MTEKMEHFDENLDLRASSKLSADLKAFFEPQRPVPPEVDRAVLDKANRYFVAVRSSQGGRRRFRWSVVWKVAAAAAVIIFAFSLDLTKKHGPATDRSVAAGIQAVDIDQNGRVDILDAFTLARNIESAGPAKKDWDINGDGKVNRDDVDMVAFAAVRLDKGVL